MNKLVCDICGGRIVVQSGGQFGECEYCGASYSLDRMREIVSGVKVSQTGSAEDVEQWRELVNQYFLEGSYQDAETIVKKILEAIPSDHVASSQYEYLQILKYCDVRNGTLVKYSGRAKNVILPPQIKRIEDKAFENTTIESIEISEGTESIGKDAFANCKYLRKVIIPKSVTACDLHAFYGCSNLTEVDNRSKINPRHFMSTPYYNNNFQESISVICPTCNGTFIIPKLVDCTCPQCSSTITTIEMITKKCCRLIVNKKEA